MIKVYIAAPYTAENPRETQVNVNGVIAVACELMQAGFAVFIPHLRHYIWLHEAGDFPYEHWLAHDLEWLPACDVLLRQFGPSSGADGEVEAARELEMPIFYDKEKLIERREYLEKLMEV